MERIQMLGNGNFKSLRLGNLSIRFFDMREEDIDMRRYINKFKKQDFKLRQLFDIFNNGLSFSSIEYNFIDKKEVY